MDNILNNFTDLLNNRGIRLSESQLHQFELYYRELVDWNERMNLTGIIEREQVYIKHFYDSLSVAFFCSYVGSFEDSRYRFRSRISQYSLENCFSPSTGHHSGFFKQADSLFKSCNVFFLGLSDVQCVHARAEDAARLPVHRDQYDLVTARAVARMAVLNEFCLPFVSVGGLFVAMKGQGVQDEIEEASFSLRELRGQWLNTHRFELPVEESTRHIVLITKTGPTPKKYPRKAGTPLKSPLI